MFRFSISFAWNYFYANIKPAVRLQTSKTKEVVNYLSSMKTVG